MQKIMFNERYGLQSAVYKKIKTHTRREPFYSAESVCCEFNQQGKLECFTYDDERKYLIHTSRYAKGEIVAIAQSYSSIFNEAYDDYFNDKYSSFRNGNLTETKGWNNKMYVKAEYMPHHINIIDIRCERLQDITDDDCIKEGIYMVYDEENNKMFAFVDTFRGHEYQFETPKEAFRSLIIALNGKKNWDSNPYPYVIVYDFKRID